MRLTEHFDTREFGCHDGTPAPAHSVPDMRRLCARYLEPLRDGFGPVTIISGYRTESHNAEVHGARHSFHIYRRARPGAAADLKCARGTPRDWYRLLDGLGVPGLGFYPDHIHADNRTGRARW